MNNVFDLNEARSKKYAIPNMDYRLKIAKMTIYQLLEEMVYFQEARTKAGGLTREVAIRGIILFTALEQESHTPEMRGMAGSYKRHLDETLETL